VPISNGTPESGRPSAAGQAVQVPSHGLFDGKNRAEGSDEVFHSLRGIAAAVDALQKKYLGDLK
jgi:hypothetical protein